MAKEMVPIAVLEDDELCNSEGLMFKWAGNSGLAVFASNKKKDASDEKLESSEKENPGIYFIREDSILNDEELRKLINESNSTFISSRNIPEGVNRQRRILDLSREHRSTIRQCIENMELSMIENKNDIYSDWVDVLDNLDNIWHLCELLYIESVPAEIILPKLLEWTRLRSSDYDITAAEVLSESHTKGADHRYPKYWDVVMGLLMEGRFEAARALLKLHSEADTSQFLEADILLSGMPKYSVYCGLSAQEFNARWKGWKSTVLSKLKSGIFASQPKLQQIMNIVGGGEESLFEHLKPYCPTWCHMMVSYLLFTEQTVKINDLSYFANECIAHYGGHSKLKLFDHTLLALLDCNLSLVIKKLQHTADGGWCSLHLANLLDVSGILSGPLGKGINVDDIMLEYGQFLMSHRSFWQVGITYLEQCKKKGKCIMKICLTRMPITSEDKALRIISVAKDHGLQEIVNKVCKVMVLEKLRTDNTAAALSWALMSDDSEMTSLIAEKYLRKYTVGSTEAELQCTQVLANLGQSVFLSSKLTLLAKYCEFHSLFNDGKTFEAGELLIRLLSSKVAPKYFWLTLLLDGLALLVLPQSIFSHDDTMLLLACLEEITTDIDNEIPKRENFDQQVDMLRRALASNFAETLLSESGNPPNLQSLKCY